MADLGHIVERFMLHVLLSAGVLLVAMALCDWAERRWSWWPRLAGWWILVVPALASFALVSLREVWDVAHGQPAAKAVTDWISWILGLAAAIWGLYRLRRRLAAAFDGGKEQS